jgi:hypothetical protein
MSIIPFRKTYFSYIKVIQEEKNYYEDRTAKNQFKKKNGKTNK